jgi:hypothetical protein
MAESKDQMSTEEVLELVTQADRAMETKLGQMLAPRARRLGGAEHREELSRLLAVASPHHVRDVLLHRMRREKMFVGRSLSFMGSLVAKTEVSRLGGPLPGWSLNNKQQAFEFLDILEVRRPASPEAPRAFADLPLTPGTVVKPASGSGSMGCYLVYGEDEVVHVKDGKKFSTHGALKDHALSVLKDRTSATSATKDQWIVEELILRDAEARQPAIDLKFWTFYGAVAFVTEINRHPTTRWDFWDRSGERIEPPGAWKATLHQGQGIAPEHVELVERISREIPYPFMRIDMLHGEDGLVFGEFTPRPGSANVLTEQWDRHLGEMWGLAENRMQQDMLQGKTFDAYNVLMARQKRRRKAARDAQRTKK